MNKTPKLGDLVSVLRNTKIQGHILGRKEPKWLVTASEENYERIKCPTMGVFIKKNQISMGENQVFVDFYRVLICSVMYWFSSNECTLIVINPVSQQT